MGLFSKLFGKADEGGKVNLTPEQFIATAPIQVILKKYRKPATLLNPRATTKVLSANISKFGGTPNLNGFDRYPCCDSCNTPLNFVVQLYRNDHPTHYYPTGKDLFQLFRCPNDKCPLGYSEQYDHKMFVYYFDDTSENKNIIQQELIQQNPSEHLEAPVPDCELQPANIDDYPNYDDFDDVINDIEAQYGEELSEHFMDNYQAIQRTKCGGYPSFTQSAFYPTCDCGKAKEFFFQLSSEDTEPHVTQPVPNNWSPHHIMIGDLGNIYFYICQDCGEESIESYWDCY